MTFGSVDGDAGHMGLRRGLRLGVVAPLVLGAATLLGLEQSITTFLMFGVTSLAGR